MAGTTSRQATRLPNLSLLDVVHRVARGSTRHSPHRSLSLMSSVSKWARFPNVSGISPAVCCHDSWRPPTKAAQRRQCGTGGCVGAGGGDRRHRASTPQPRAPLRVGTKPVAQDHPQPLSPYRVRYVYLGVPFSTVTKGCTATVVCRACRFASIWFGNNFNVADKPAVPCILCILPTSTKQITRQAFFILMEI